MECNGEWIQCSFGLASQARSLSERIHSLMLSDSYVWVILGQKNRSYIQSKRLVKNKGHMSIKSPHKMTKLFCYRIREICYASYGTISESVNWQGSPCPPPPPPRTHTHPDKTLENPRWPPISYFTLSRQKNDNEDSIRSKINMIGAYLILYYDIYEEKADEKNRWHSQNLILVIFRNLAHLTDFF